MKRSATTILLTAVLLAAIAVLAFTLLPQRDSGLTLKLYAGAGLRLAVDRLVAAFARDTGITVLPDYGGSGVIIARAREDPSADLFLPGDAWYVQRLQELAGTVARSTPVAQFIPTIIVARGNPKNIRSLADLARPDILAGLGKAESCQIGRVSASLLKKAGVDPASVRRQESLTVNELGVWVKTHAVDAAIVWDAIATNIASDVDALAIPPAQNIPSRVDLARLTTSRYPGQAEQFLDYVAGPTGRAILEASGYRLPEAP